MSSEKSSGSSPERSPTTKANTASASKQLTSSEIESLKRDKKELTAYAKCSIFARWARRVKESGYPWCLTTLGPAALYPSAHLGNLRLSCTSIQLTSLLRTL